MKPPASAGEYMPRLRLLRRWTWRGRLAGLIGRCPRRPRPPSPRPVRVAGLWLGPCAAVHTFGMRYAIDVVFLNRHGRVIRLVPALGPRRWAFCRRAASVVEFETGSICLEEQGISRIEAAVQTAVRGNLHRYPRFVDRLRGQSDGHQHDEQTRPGIR